MDHESHCMCSLETDVKRNECNEEFEDQNNRQMHTPLKCQKCETQFTDKYSLSLHNCNAEATLQCDNRSGSVVDDCGDGDEDHDDHFGADRVENFSDGGDDRCADEDHDGEEVVAPRPRRRRTQTDVEKQENSCQICQRTYTQRVVLRSHYRQKHSNDERIHCICLYCNNLLESPEALATHFSDNLKCEECKAQLKCETRLLQHRAAHQNMFACNVSVGCSFNLNLILFLFFIF